MFEITYEDDQYFDMTMFFSVNDEQRTGGRLVITIDKQAQTALATLSGDDERGDEFFWREISDLPIDWAAAIAKATWKENR